MAFLSANSEYDSNSGLSSLNHAKTDLEKFRDTLKNSRFDFDNTPPFEAINQDKSKFNESFEYFKKEIKRYSDDKK